MADTHVRESREDDANELGRIHVATWHQAYDAILPPAALEIMTEENAVAAWRDAITDPPTNGHRVFTAYERSSTGESTVGFIALAPPAEDEEDITAPTAEIVTLLVEPRWGRRGHGSRLLSAAVTVARQGGAAHLICWVIARDTVTAGFLRSAGWERDGWTRTLDAGGQPTDQYRFATDIAEAKPAADERPQLPIVSPEHPTADG
ncbi:acetyltransferase (GNAT) family protein [Antricoccus suffuscus]|uniref:Acetyltransferase (GNAT) family protein n=1 Tax=Antricoccus suffuscus TaxID=1629062 RepID=A0A2T1A5G7_9ACTN|nr:GNAT family N-acetyltransferase [Antricoccus suffuscus]PRZ43588.1 acetyltransferase (GNAT) family protein [Antricoccus suffuscus]